MQYRTETRDGKVYIYDSATAWDKPEMITLFYETNGDPSLIPNLTPVITLATGILVARCERREYPLRKMTDQATFVESTPIPKPRGKYSWRNGQWNKTP